jgi:hypothetical protein
MKIVGSARHFLLRLRRRDPSSPSQTLALTRSTILCLVTNDFSSWNMSLPWSSRLETVATWRKIPRQLNFRIACISNWEPHRTHFQTLVLIRSTIVCSMIDDDSSWSVSLQQSTERQIGNNGNMKEKSTSSGTFVLSASVTNLVTSGLSLQL